MRNDAKKILRVISLSTLFVFILVYVFFRSQGLIFGVKIKNVKIAEIPEALLMENSTSKASGTEIRKITGNAKNAVNLTLNDREISIDQQGNFEETIALLPGYNTISIKAKDKFGNDDEKNYQLMYSAPAE